MSTKKYTGETADIERVDVEANLVRITAIAGEVRATTTLRITPFHDDDVENSVAFETERVLSFAEMIDAGIQKGIQATRNDEGQREGATATASGPAVNVGRAMSDLGVLRYAVHGSDEDENEGLREGAVVGSASRVRSFMDGGAPFPEEPWIRIPNSEYADLLDAKRRAETSLAGCRAALQSVPEVGAVTLPDGTVAQVRVESYAALEAIWTALGNYPYERPASIRFDDPTDGEISLDDFVAATTAGVSDMSDIVQDDGGPVEPELDIDGLIMGKVKSSVFNSELYESLDDVQKLRAELAAATARADALEAEKAEALASVAGFETSPVDATTYTVRYGDSSLTVTGSASGVAHLVKLAHGGFEYGAAA